MLFSSNHSLSISLPILSFYFLIELIVIIILLHIRLKLVHVIK
jgi:hypothetical protein